MSNRPKMYQNVVSKNFKNNKKVYFSYDSSNNMNNSNDIIKKVNDIMNANDFIYTRKVNVLMDNQIFVKKIIGIKDNNLVTLDNEYIPISKINDIYRY